MQISLKYLLLSALIPWWCQSAGQEQVSTGNGNDLNLFESRLSGEIYSPPDRFANSQNYFEDWKKGDVTLISGEVVLDQKLQYNAYLDELFWLQPSIYREVRLDKQLIESFTVLNGHPDNYLTFKRISNINEGTGRYDFFALVLYEDKVSLYSRRVLRESGRTRSTTLGNNIVSRILLMSDHKYFLKTEDNVYISISRNRRSLYNAFPEKRSEIRSILRNNRNRIRNEADLVDALVLLNSILTGNNHSR